MEHSAIGSELRDIFGEGDREKFLIAVNDWINAKQITIPDRRTFRLAAKEVMDSEGAAGHRWVPRTELARQLQDAVEYARVKAHGRGGRRRKSRKSKKRARKTRRRY